MAVNAKISDLTALVTPDDADLLAIVDVSDTTDAASGTTKSIALVDLLAGAGGGLGPVTLTGTPTSGQVPTATSGTAATWQTPSGGGGSTIWARAEHNAAQSIPNITPTALNFNSELFDTDAIHDNSTNNTRLTCKTAGVYLIIGQVGFASNSTGVRQTAFRLNGTTYLAFSSVGASPNYAARHMLSTVYPLAVNDYLEIIVYHEAGVSINTEVSTGSMPTFQMIRMGA